MKKENEKELKRKEKEKWFTTVSFLVIENFSYYLTIQ